MSAYSGWKMLSYWYRITLTDWQSNGSSDEYNAAKIHQYFQVTAIKVNLALFVQNYAK